MGSEPRRKEKVTRTQEPTKSAGAQSWNHLSKLKIKNIVLDYDPEYKVNEAMLKS